MSLCRFAITSSTGECGLFAGPPSIDSSRPFDSSLGLLAALGVTSLPSTAVMAGGEGGFALTGGSAGEDLALQFPTSKKELYQLDSLEPTTGMDMPWSWTSGAALDAGESSAKSFLGGLTLQLKQHERKVLGWQYVLFWQWNHYNDALKHPNGDFTYIFI